MQATSIFVPDGLNPDAALARTTHLAIGAHPDDAEFMTWHAIGECRSAPDRWFTAVVITDGAGSPRGAGPQLDAQQLRQTRREEARRAAVAGGYSALVMLDRTSAEARAAGGTIADELERLLLAARPRKLFTHNPFDRHQTHLAVLLHAVAALRRLPPQARPEQVWGCEVWGSLDWLPEQERTAFDVTAHEALGVQLTSLHASQLAGGKRYDLANPGRRRANATFDRAREPDRHELAELAVDLTPLLRDPTLGVGTFAAGLVARFADEVRQRLESATGKR